MPLTAPREDTATHVPASLPPTALAPEPAKAVRFLTALLLFWCRPRRYGPHLAAASFKRAFAAHVMSVITAGAIISLLLLGTMTDLSLGLRDLLRQLAETILIQAGRSAGTAENWFPMVVFLCCVPLVELGLVALGTLLMPFGACGDRASSVWKRSVKTVYWSTTSLIPISIILAVAILALRQTLGLTEARDLSLFWPWFIAALMLWAISLLPTTILGIQHYVGPPDGPAFAPREPCCDICGYLIIGLPLASRCPECGTAVRESLSGGRRLPTVWQQCQFKPRGLLDLIRTHWAVLRGNDFFRSLPVHSGLATARHAWWASWACFILCGLVVMRISWFFLPGDFEIEAGMGPIAIYLLAVPLAFQFLVMFASCFWAQFRYGIRDYRVSAIVCYYASPLMWPLVAIICVASVLSVEQIAANLAALPIGRLGATTITALHVAGTAALLAAIAALGFWWSRLLKAIWSVRFANV